MWSFYLQPIENVICHKFLSLGPSGVLAGKHNVGVFFIFDNKLPPHSFVRVRIVRLDQFALAHELIIAMVADLEGVEPLP